MPIKNGLEAAREISSVAPQTTMVLFTLDTTKDLIKDAREAGFKSVVSKLDGAATLVASLETMLKGSGNEDE